MLERVLFFTIALAALVAAPQFRLHDDGLRPSMILCALMVALLVAKLTGLWPK